ncbi:MAG: hypothetical protein ACWGOV_02905 [Acidiferrobacterales bacterium]
MKTTRLIGVGGILACSLFLFVGNTNAVEGKTVDGVYLKATVRTPVQMAAFYEARGFPVKATALLAKYCFVTVILRNRSNQVVWLEPARWSIQANDGRVVTPRSLEEWNKEWEAVGLPAAQRAAFQWTQLPKSRDLQPHEPVGGNIAFRRFTGEFSLKMDFATGPERGGTPIRAEFTGLNCDPSRTSRK